MEFRLSPGKSYENPTRILREKKNVQKSYEKSCEIFLQAFFRPFPRKFTEILNTENFQILVGFLQFLVGFFYILVGFCQFS